MWAAGIAAGAALVGLWSVGGAGFLRLSGVVLVLVGAAAAAAGTGLVGWLAVAAAIGATVVAGKRPYSVALFAAVTVLLAAVAIADSPVVLALSGSLFLGRRDSRNDARPLVPGRPSNCPDGRSKGS